MHEGEGGGGLFAGHYGILDVYILILQIPRLIWECLHMHKLYLGKRIANRQIYAVVWLLLK